MGNLVTNGADSSLLTRLYLLVESWGLGNMSPCFAQYYVILLVYTMKVEYLRGYLMHM